MSAERLQISGRHRNGLERMGVKRTREQKKSTRCRTLVGMIVGIHSLKSGKNRLASRYGSKRKSEPRPKNESGPKNQKSRVKKRIDYSQKR